MILDLVKGAVTDIISDAIDTLDWAEEELILALDSGRGWLVGLLHKIND